MPTVPNLIQDVGIVVLLVYVIVMHNWLRDIQEDINRILESGWFPEPREERK
jgi:hypothetical protein